MSSKNPVLRSCDNPHGWKLEDLLCQIRKELLVKTEKITGDESSHSMKVQCNNLSVMRLLFIAESLQLDNCNLLSGKARDEGPNGNPRIGVRDHVIS